MQHTTPGETWTDWLAANADRDGDDMVEALREIILRDARYGVGMGVFTAAWANKKLPLLGITEQIAVENVYVIEQQITGTFTHNVSGTSRADALARFSATLAERSSGTIANVQPAVGATPTIVSGPEDVDVAAVLADAPQTVDAILAKLREIMMLAVISGPHMCVPGTSDKLEEYGLAPLPDRREYVITRPVDAVMQTVVNAYDEASAQRVADWRWDNNHTGYTVSEAFDTDKASVALNG